MGKENVVELQTGPVARKRSIPRASRDSPKASFRKTDAKKNRKGTMMTHTQSFSEFHKLKKKVAKPQ